MEWDVLFLGKCLGNCHNYQHLDYNLYKSKGNHCGHAYIVSKRGAKKIQRNMEIGEFVNLPIDCVLREMGHADKLDIYVFHPSLIRQDVARWSSNIRPDTSHNNQECENI